MPHSIDLNADLGEGLPHDAALMPYISSANIACGYHAGDEETMQRTVALCLKYGVAIGAHPSFPDREHFGRTELDITPAAAAAHVSDQLRLMQDICDALGATMHHVKPHGALYNMSARLPDLARHIALAVKAHHPDLWLYGLAGSHSLDEASRIGLRTVAEFFADRSYQPDGSLTPRSQPGALITEVSDALHQAMSIAQHHCVMAANGQSIRLNLPPGTPASICLHGDGPHALTFARNIYHQFISCGIQIRAVA